MARPQGLRFMLVRLYPHYWHQWRAIGTVPEEASTPSPADRIRTVKIIFFADDDTKARAHVRAKYPDCTFTDEPFGEMP